MEKLPTRQDVGAEPEAADLGPTWEAVALADFEETPAYRAWVVRQHREHYLGDGIDL